MTFRRRTVFLPTRRLALVVAALGPTWLVADATGTGLPLVLIVALIGAIAFDAASLPGADRVTIERNVPPTAGLGDPIEVGYRIRTRWSRSLRAVLAEGWPAAITRAGPALLPFELTPEAAAVIRVELRAERRGEFAAGPVALRITGPLGLLTRMLRYDSGDAIVIAPSLAGVRQYRLLALQHRLNEIGVRAIRSRGESTSFDRLREYVPGDDPRHLDWKASARRRRLITREFGVEQGQTVLLVIDAGRLMTQLAGERTRFEHALTAALTLADVAANGGDRIGLFVFDDQPRVWVPPARAGAAVRAIRRALVPIQPRLVEPDYAGAFHTLAARQRKRALLVFFGDLIDARSSQALIAQLGHAAVRHLPLFVALRNEELIAAAAGAGGSGEAEPWRRAAAEELLVERETGLAAMRRRGVAVLDVPPSAMTAVVVNRYLEIKARAAL